MRILAIDSATPAASVALVDGEKVIREDFINFKKTHSETLMPTVERVLKECETGLNDIDAIAVSVGPGSFTGLRIGMAAVKGLSLGSGKPVVAVGTLEMLAANVAGSDALVGAILDARKNEVYCGFYDVSNSLPRLLEEPSACSPEQFVTRIQQLAEKKSKGKIILLGDGYFPYRDYFDEALKTRQLKVPGHLMLPRASAAGSIAADKAARGEFENIYTLRPVYIRLSEAEYRLGKGEV